MNFKSKILKVLCALAIVMISRCSAAGGAGSIVDHFVLKNKTNNSCVALFGFAHNDQLAHPLQSGLLRRALQQADIILLESNSWRSGLQTPEIQLKYDFPIISPELLAPEFTRKIKNVDRRLLFDLFYVINACPDEVTDDYRFCLEKRLLSLSQELCADHSLAGNVKKFVQDYIQNLIAQSRESFDSIQNATISDKEAAYVIFSLSSTLLDLEAVRQIVNENNAPRSLIACITGVYHSHVVTRILLQLKDCNGENVFELLHHGDLLFPSDQAEFNIFKESKGVFLPSSGPKHAARLEEYLSKISLGSSRFPSKKYIRPEIWQGIERRIQECVQDKNFLCPCPDYPAATLATHADGGKAGDLASDSDDFHSCVGSDDESI